MTGPLVVHWRLLPCHPPKPMRHCSTCGQTRPFRSSGKIRLNANGRKLDAWLIYKCDDCDRTWNRPLYERVDIRTIAPETVLALQQSTPEWVYEVAHDVAGLRQYCNTINHSENVVLQRSQESGDLADCTHVHLSLRVPYVTGCRLDRLVSHEFRLSRRRVGEALRAKDIVVRPKSKTIRQNMVVEIRRSVLAHLTEQERRAILWGDAYPAD
ncbi:MAG: DUF1062 domain-containing protein [Pseudomonadota bacterium]